MAAAPSLTFQQRKARLLASFLTQLDKRLEDARQGCAALVPGTVQPQRLQDLHLLFHTLKGSSASFGLEALGDLAQGAGDALKQALTDGALVTESLIALLERTLERCADPALRQTATAGNAGFEPGADAPADAAHGRHQPQVAESDDARRGRHIYLCDDDAQLGEQMCAQLACFGYRVTPFESLDALCAAVMVEPPAALILDVVFPQGDDAGPTALAAINARCQPPVPTVFISCRDDFASRLQAVKAGGRAFCTKPTKPTELVDLLDTLTRTETPDPFHILVVDDDPDIARLHALILEQAGMIVRIADRADQVPGLLRDFNADLVLTDMYMPECSGPELARVLRQMPGYLSLPIVYVSSETDVERQLAAMEVGADGFLIKPVAPARLVSEVSLRAERMRTLRALMVRDGLTGLLNHKAILQHLQLAVANARRDARPLSFAMIDVDRFKQVNDRFGHPVGDQVLLALSRGLRLRLRDGDPVGRYGGEEFALVLAGSDAAQSKIVIDRLREAFSAVAFYAGDERFNCTFSAGVADLAQFPSLERLTEAADMALYRAKRGGRNRVEIAAPDDGEGAP